MKVGTGLAIGNDAHADLVTQAVRQAMKAANIEIASSVLLFLTAEFARAPAPALHAAAKAACCTQIMGCSAPGIFTEQDWVVDAPAAAAMVFSDGVRLQVPDIHNPEQLLLALTAPNAINTTWMATPAIRFGGVSGDATGQGPFSVWQHGRGTASGHCEAKLGGVRGAVGAAHGLRLLGVPKKISKSQGYDVQALADEPALATLRHACGKKYQALSLHQLMAVYADSAEAIKRGDYQLASLVSQDEADNSVTIAKLLKPGQYLSWAVREADTAIADLEQTISRLQTELTATPDFALLFSCLGRGPYFYGNVDRDLLLLKQRFAGMPFIGFYGNGEIAPRNGISELLQYSAVLGLFKAEGK
jgi:small ligand-binding sensory domain FIST